MPVIGVSAYPTLEEIMLLARSFVNDTFPGATNTPGEGRTLTDSAPFTVPFVNSAIRQLQRILENNGVGTFTVDNWILQLSPSPTVDPAAQAFIDYTGYFDNTNMNAIPTLPPDLLIPLELWERTTGSNLPFQHMTNMDVLPSWTQSGSLRIWNWTGDQLNLIGSTVAKDVRMRYKARAIPPVVAGTNFNSAFITCVDCQDALAYQIAYNYAMARGGFPSLPALKQDRDEAIGGMVTRYVRMQQSEPIQRIPYGDGGSCWPGGNADY